MQSLESRKYGLGLLGAAIRVVISVPLSGAVGPLLRFGVGGLQFRVWVLG